MSEGLFDTLKSDTLEAAYRVAGTQITKATKNTLVNVLRSRGVNNKYINGVSNFLDTDLGGAAISSLVGVMFDHLPMFKNDKRAQTMAKEFRVGGLALAGNLLADAVIGDLFTNMGKMLDHLPNLASSNQKVRVSLPSCEELEDDHSSTQMTKSSF